MGTAPFPTCSNLFNLDLTVQGPFLSGSSPPCTGTFPFWLQPSLYRDSQPWPPPPLYREPLGVDIWWLLKHYIQSESGWYASTGMLSCYLSTVYKSCFRPQTKLRQGNVFTGVCLFTGGGISGPWYQVPSGGWVSRRWVCPGDGYVQGGWACPGGWVLTPRIHGIWVYYSIQSTNGRYASS